MVVELVFAVRPVTWAYLAGAPLLTSNMSVVVIVVLVVLVCLYARRLRRLRRWYLRGYTKHPKRLDRPPIPPSVKAIVWRRDGARCRHCGISDAESFALRGCHLQLDHIVPWSWGGLSTVGNLQLLCRRCNLAKGNRYVG